MEVLLSAIAERNQEGESNRSLAILKDVSDAGRPQEEVRSSGKRRARKQAYGPTIRELGVLDLTVVGKTDKEIARELGISVQTASRHVSNILGKLKVASRTQAAGRALREGPVEGSEVRRESELLDDVV